MAKMKRTIRVTEYVEELEGEVEGVANRATVAGERNDAKPLGTGVQVSAPPAKGSAENHAQGDDDHDEDDHVEEDRDDEDGDDEDSDDEEDEDRDEDEEDEDEDSDDEEDEDRDEDEEDEDE